MARSKTSKGYRPATCAHCRDTIVMGSDDLLVGHTNNRIGETCRGSYRRPLPDDTILDLLAWDISDAFAKTEDDHRLDFGLDDIRAALPAFIAAVQNNAHLNS